MPKRVLVVLSGCGFLDGSEIHEAVLTLLALDRAGADVTCAAPDQPQRDVVNHAEQKPAEEVRNVLIESARIARGEIRALAAVRASEFDAIFLPGGFGAAKNLSSFAVDGQRASVNADLARLLREFRAANKPIGAVCISPAVVVAALREGEVTVGAAGGAAEAIDSMGGRHVVRAVTEIHVDEGRKIVTAPAYMCDAGIADVSLGIERAVAAVLARA